MSAEDLPPFRESDGDWAYGHHRVAGWRHGLNLYGPVAKPFSSDAEYEDFLAEMEAALDEVQFAWKGERYWLSVDPSPKKSET